MTDDDRNLLELAAKAAGLVYDHRYGIVFSEDEDGNTLETQWNPLTDDGDALRLAVDLQLGISVPPVSDGRVGVVTFYGPIISIVEYPKNGDRHAATRRAIVRAAAEIVK